MPFRYWVRPTPYNALLQAHTMPVPPTYYVLVPFVALDPTCLGFTQSASRPGCRTAASLNTHNKGLEKDSGSSCMIWLTFLLSALIGRSISWSLPWLIALRRRSILYVAWTTVANLMIFHRTGNKRLPQPCFATNYMSRTLPGQSLHVPPAFLDRSVAFALWRFCFTWNLRRVPLVLGLFLVTGYSTTVERPSFPRLDHPGFSAEPPIWIRGNGPHWCLCLRPQSPPPKYWESLKFLRTGWKGESASWQLSLLPS